MKSPSRNVRLSALGLVLSLHTLARAQEAATPPSPAPSAPAAAAEAEAPPATAAATAPPAPAEAAEPVAETPPADAPAAEEKPAEAPPPKKPPYSLPWALRPAIPVNVVRSDTSFAFSEPASGKNATTIATTLLASYKVTDEIAPLVRLGLVSHSPPDGAGESATGFMNPVVGGMYGPKLPGPFKLGLFLGLSVPIGSGGGKTPDRNEAAAMKAGIPARSAMDNAMFAQNYFTVFPGVGFAVVTSGFTAQVEATILRLTKVRGPDSADDGNTNFTSGLHVGYFLIPQLSLGAELRYQRWLSNPAAVRADATRAARDNTTFAIGPRFHLEVGEKKWLRPGISYTMALDDPMSNAKYKIVQLDIPFVF